jgi:plastocyanin
VTRRQISARCGVASALLGLGLAAVPGAVAGEAKANYALKGQVYPVVFKIQMKKASGVKLVSIKRGTYRIKVEDPSTIHNFRLRGPGVNKATSVAGKTEKIWTVTLKKGSYTFVCDPHASTMHGAFKVT